jgi:hypothetical protein
MVEAKGRPMLTSIHARATVPLTTVLMVQRYGLGIIDQAMPRGLTTHQETSTDGSTAPK